MIMERFQQVKEDSEFLRFVSDNARKYYENYLSPTSSVDFTLKLCGYEF